MRRILHILTRQDATLAHELIQHQRALTDCTVDVVELSQPEPDYEALVEKIFAADSVEVW